MIIEGKILNQGKKVVSATDCLETRKGIVHAKLKRKESELSPLLTPHCPRQRTLDTGNPRHYCVVGKIALDL